MLLTGIILIGIGLWMIMKPSQLWTVAESWKSSDATEPSELYVWSTRMGGVMTALAGTGAVVAHFLT